MIILISPAKNMDFTSPLPGHLSGDKGADPCFLDRAESLVQTELNHRSPRDLSDLMGISDELARNTAASYANFRRPDNPSRAALFAYSGTVFQNMGPRTLDETALAYAREHLRILSALYGCLSPLDRIEPYRLEMKTPLAPGEYPSLAKYWNGRITPFLNDEAERAEASAFLNLASGEYTRALDRKRLSKPFITVNFKENRRGKLVTVGTYAKMARGKMVRRILEERPVSPDEISEWDIMGYTCNKGMSGDDEILFVRDK